MFGLLMLFVYEPFGLFHQQNDAAEGLCSKFDSNLRRKNVVYNEFCISCLVNMRYSYSKDQVGTLFATDSEASPYLGHSKPFALVLKKTIFI